MGALDYFVAHNYTDGNGDFKFENSEGRIVKRTNNNFKWNDTFIKLRYAFDSSALLQGFVQFHNAERGVPGPLSFPSEAAIQKDDSWKSNFRYEHKLTPNLNFEAQMFFHKFKQNFDDSSAFVPIQSQHKNDEFGLNLQSDWRVSTVTDVTGGYEFRQDKVNSTDIASQKRTSHSVYLQNQIKLPMQRAWTKAHLRLIPAFRLDKYTDADVQFSPKLGFIFSYVKDLQLVLRGNWGRSYRMPSFNDLYWPAGAFTAGNPALIPETGTGFDIGFLLNFSKKGYWGFAVNYFNTNLDNLIIWGPRQDGIWSPQNVQHAKINGVEAKLSIQDAGELFDFEANYNYLKAVDDGDDQRLHGNQLIYRPKHKVDLNLQIHFSRLELTGTYHFVSQRFTAMDNSFALQEYSIINVGGAWLQPIVGGHFKIQVEVRNLNDQQIQIIADFPAPGREYRTTVGFAF
ncbi:MAG: TonB-dependent receptor plug domain-containing protein [bacterium]